eukprot:s5156_g2.t1
MDRTGPGTQQTLAIRDRTGTRQKPDNTGQPDGPDRPASQRIRAGQEQTGPDRTGQELDNTGQSPAGAGQNQTGPDRPAMNRTTPDSNRKEPDRITPDSNRKEPDRSRLGRTMTRSRTGDCRGPWTGHAPDRTGNVHAPDTRRTEPETIRTGTGQGPKNRDLRIWTECRAGPWRGQADGIGQSQ